MRCIHSFPQALKRQCHDKVFFDSCVDALGLINGPRTSFTFFQSSIKKLQFILNCLIFQVKRFLLFGMIWLHHGDQLVPGSEKIFKLF